MREGWAVTFRDRGRIYPPVVVWTDELKDSTQPGVLSAALKIFRLRSYPKEGLSINTCVTFKRIVSEENIDEEPNPKKKRPSVAKRRGVFSPRKSDKRAKSK